MALGPTAKRTTEHWEMEKHILSFKFYLQLKKCVVLCFISASLCTMIQFQSLRLEGRFHIYLLTWGKLLRAHLESEFDTWHHKIINRQICNLHKCDVETRCALEVKFEIHASSQSFEINNTCRVIDSEFLNKRERFFFLLGNTVQENKSQTNYWSKQSIFMP